MAKNKRLEIPSSRLFFLKVSVFKGHQELSFLLLIQRNHESFYFVNQIRNLERIAYG